MDNLTHSLTALAMSRAGLKRFYARPVLVLMIAANIPDIDVTSAFGGAIRYLEYHRWLTHSIAMLPLMAVAPVLIALAVTRSTAGWKQAYLLSFLGVASHLLLDWTNAYGIRLLLPFSGEWVHGDLNSIVDLWIWAVLLLATLGPMLGRLVSSEIGAKPGSGRGMAIFALLFVLIYDGARYQLHERALAVLNSRIYEGGVPLRVAAFPSSANPLRWVSWVETANTATRFDLNLLDTFDPAAGTKFYKPEPNAAIEAAKKTQAFRMMGNFAIYPLWSVLPTDEPEGAVRVELRDERFPFAATAVVDKAGRVVSSAFHL